MHPPQLYCLTHPPCHKHAHTTQRNTTQRATKTVGFGWASYVVALGALLGIVTGVLANIMGVSRILCSLARTHLAPPLFGRVSRRFRTPFNATAVLVAASLPLTLLSDLPTLIDMVAAGTLCVFAVVALALLWHRYADPKAPARDNAKPAAGLAVLVASGIGALLVGFAAAGPLFAGTPLYRGRRRLHTRSHHTPPLPLPPNPPSAPQSPPPPGSVRVRVGRPRPQGPAAGGRPPRLLRRARADVRRRPRGDAVHAPRVRVAPRARVQRAAVPVDAGAELPAQLLPDGVAAGGGVRAGGGARERERERERERMQNGLGCWQSVWRAARETSHKTQLTDLITNLS